PDTPQLVVERVGVHVDHGDPFRAAADFERQATDPLAPQRASGWMLVNENARPFEGARAIELPELLHRARGFGGVVQLRLRVGAERIALGIHHAYRIGYDVEDRFELGDAPRQILAQLFAFGDVVAGEAHSPAYRFVSEG